MQKGELRLKIYFNVKDLGNRFGLPQEPSFGTELKYIKRLMRTYQKSKPRNTLLIRRNFFRQLSNTFLITYKSFGKLKRYWTSKSRSRRSLFLLSFQSKSTLVRIAKYRELDIIFSYSELHMKLFSYNN